MSAGLRIAILAHSTNPRGGVVHALELAEALCDLGHEAVVHAPDPSGRGFFRTTACPTIGIPARPAPAETTAMVEARVAEYVRHFEVGRHRRFDVFHAQDGISGNALATLAERGLISRHGRTVHHIDGFADPRLEALQARAIRPADRHFVVSRHWQEKLQDAFGIRATIVGNGVDLARFRPDLDGREDDLRRGLGLGPGPILLAVGGVEHRKNTIGILQAFVQVRAVRPTAQLVIAGGASLLDHGGYRAGFQDELRASGLTQYDVILTGPMPDADMPALYRIADILVFASLKEGFGLVALEAMASGTPVVLSAIEPFTDLFDEDAAAWCDPARSGSIADATLAALHEPAARVRRARSLSQRFTWRAVAEAHLETYAALAEPTREAAHA